MNSNTTVNGFNPQQPQNQLTENFMVKAYSPRELCQLYGVSRKTLVTWLKPFSKQIGKRHGRYYTVLQVQSIVSHLGVPHWLE